MPVSNIQWKTCVIYFLSAFRGISQDVEFDTGSPKPMQTNFDHFSPLKNTPAVRMIQLLHNFIGVFL